MNWFEKPQFGKHLRFKWQEIPANVSLYHSIEIFFWQA